jgi:uncharacterized linocin/CFP29 family protein
MILDDGIHVDDMRDGGNICDVLFNHDFQIGALRPYRSNDESDSNRYITVTNGQGKPEAKVTHNASLSTPFRRDDWTEIDRAVISAAKPRLKLFGDIRSQGLEYNIPNGLGKTSFQHEAVSDTSQATISMDGLRRSYADRPVFDLRNMPLPIIHKDFHFSARQLAVSRNGGSPLDTTTASQAARRVAEVAEELSIGTLSSYNFGGSYIYGLINYPGRLTHIMTDPTSGGWIPSKTVQEVIHMRLMSTQNYYYGPWMLYVSLPWDEYLEADYKSNAASSTMTLRERLQKIGGIVDVRTLDYLTGYQMVLVQMTQDVIRAVIGMDIITVQWPSEGGMMVNFKVMSIMLPQIRSDYYGSTGIVHGASTVGFAESPATAPVLSDIMGR